MKAKLICGGIAAALAVLLVIAVYACFGIAKPMYDSAEESGAAIGELEGKLVGMAVGSYNGVTQGLAQGMEDGKEVGLSAEDTTAEVVRSISEIGRLEVLSAAVSLQNQHEAGGGDYKSLEVLLGNAVFTVDLSAAVVSETADGLTITVPQPQMELYFDESKTRKLAEIQKFPFSGSAEDGYDSYLNSRKELFEESSEKISNYDWLIEQARDSALKNVKLLAEKVSIEGKTVTVQLAKESGV